MSQKFIFTQEIQVRDYLNADGVAIGLEVDFDLPYPDNKPPYRFRRKSPFTPGPKLPRERAIKQTLAWAEIKRQNLWEGGRPLSRVEKAAAKRLEEANRPAPIPTLKDFIPRWVTGRLVADAVSESTQEIYERNLRLHILPVYGERKLDSFNKEDFQTLKGALRKQQNGKPRSASQLNDILATLYRVLTDAAEWEVIPKSPHKPEYLPEIVEQTEIYNEVQYRALVDSAKKKNWQTHLLVLLAGDAGLRVGELLALRWSDIDWRSGHLKVKIQDTQKEGIKPPKNKQWRKVPLSPALKVALEDQRTFSGRILLYKEKPLPRHIAREWLYQAETAADLPEKSIHKLRHVFATRYLQHGGNVRDLQELLGHSDLETTQGYLHAIPGEAERVMARLGLGEI